MTHHGPNDDNGSRNESANGVWDEASVSTFTRLLAEAIERAPSTLEVLKFNQKGERHSLLSEDSYHVWCSMHESWTLHQGICLLMGYDPETPNPMTLVTFRRDVYRLYSKVLASCVGISLHPVDANAPNDKQRFRKEDFIAAVIRLTPGLPKLLDDAMSRECPAALAAAHRQVSATLSPINQNVDLAQQPSTTRTRRHDALREFREDIYTRGARAGLNWARSRDPLPITRGDLLELFLRQHAEIPRVSAPTFTDDLKAVGAKCAAGSRNDPKNPVARLFF